ncbi:MAG: TolC family protein, partial [Candidatus Margulisiibacteriota bacterium]
MASALQNNLDLRKAQESLKQYELAVEAANSSLSPQLNGSAGASHSKSTSETHQDSYILGLSASQLLFDGAKTQLNLDKSRLEFQANRAAYQVASAALRNNLRKAYIEVQQYQELLRISYIVQSRRKQQYELIFLKYEAGREHKGSLLKSKASLTQAEQNGSSTQRTLELKQKKFASELGITDANLLFVSDNLSPSSLSISVDLTVLSLGSPYYLQYKLEKLGRDMALKSAQANQGASLQANANYGLSDTLFFPQNNSWSLGLSGSYPFWDGGNRQSQTQVAQSQLKVASMNETVAYKTVLMNLEEAKVNYLNAKSRVVVDAQFLEASEERSRIAEVQYTTGQL